MADSDRAPDELAEWGRFEFRWLVRKTSYTLAQRGAWATLFAAVGLERRRGLITRQTAVGLVGARMVDFLLAHGDLEEVDERELRFHGWTTAQEPLERTRTLAAERAQRYRDRKAAARDANVTQRDESVTLSVSVSRNDSALTTEERAETTVELPPARAHARPGPIVRAAIADGSIPKTADDDVWDLTMLVEQLTGRPWAYGPGNRSFETLRLDCRDFGRAAVEQALRAVPLPLPDAAKMVLAAHDVLVPFVDSRATTAAAQAQQAEREAAERDRKAREATEARRLELERIAAQPVDPEAERIRQQMRATWGSGVTPTPGRARMRGDGPGGFRAEQLSSGSDATEQEPSAPGSPVVDPDRLLSDPGPSNAERSAGRKGS